jgi:hypothetical protein
LTTRERKAELQRRCRYRRIPVADVDWLALRSHAEGHGLRRTRFIAALIRDFNRHPHPIELTVQPETGWGHAQRGKPRPARTPRSPAPIEGHLRCLPPAEAAEIAERDWLARGAPLLGPNATRRELE